MDARLSKKYFHYILFQLSQKLKINCIIIIQFKQPSSSMQQIKYKERQIPINSNAKFKTFNQEIKENSCPNIWLNQSNSKISHIQSKNQKKSPQYQQIQLKINSQSPSQSQQQILSKVSNQHRQLWINQRPFHHHDFQINNFKSHSIQASQKSKCKFDLNQFSQIKSRPNVKENNSGSNQSVQKHKFNQNIQIKFGYQIEPLVQSQQKTFSRLKINSNIQKKEVKINKYSTQKLRMSQNSQIVSEFNQSMKSKLSAKRAFDRQKQKKIDIKEYNEENYKKLNIELEDDNENDLIKLISSRPIEFQYQQESSYLTNGYFFDRIGISEQLKQFVGIINQILKKTAKNVDQFKYNQSHNYEQCKSSQNKSYLKQKIQQKNKQLCHQQQLESDAEQIIFNNGKYLIQIIDFCTKNKIFFISEALQYFKKLNKQHQSDLQIYQDHNYEVHWSLSTLSQNKIILPKLCTLKQLILFTSLFKIQLFKQDQPITATKNKNSRQFMRQIQFKHLILNQKQLDEEISQLLKEHQQKKCSRCLNQNILNQNKSFEHKIDKKVLCINKLSVLRHHFDDKTFLQYRIYIWKIFQCLKEDLLNLNQNLIQIEKQLNYIQKKFIKFLKGNNDHVQFFRNSLQRLIKQKTGRNQNKNIQKGDLQNQITQLKTIRNYKPKDQIQVKHKKQSLLQVKTFRLNYEQLRNATQIPVQSKTNKQISNNQNALINYNQFYYLFAGCNTFTKNQIILLYKYLCCISDKKQYKITDTNKFISLTTLQQYTNRSLKYQQLQQNIGTNNQIKYHRGNEHQVSEKIVSKQEKRGINISVLLKKQKDYKLYIQQLQQNKQKLMQIIHLKDKQISHLKKINLLSQVKFQNQIKVLESTNKYQKQQMKRQYEQRIAKLTQSNRFQQQQLCFYRQQLQNLINEINYQSSLSNRYPDNRYIDTIQTDNKFKDENKYKQGGTGKICKKNNNGIRVNQNKNLLQIKIDEIRKKINQNNSILELNQSYQENQQNSQFQQQFD